MAIGPHIFCARSEVAIKHHADGQSARIRTARVCPPELRQSIGVLPDADLDMDRLLRLGVADIGRKRLVHLRGVIQALEISAVADDQLHYQLHPDFHYYFSTMARLDQDKCHPSQSPDAASHCEKRKMETGAHASLAAGPIQRVGAAFQTV